MQYCDKKDCIITNFGERISKNEIVASARSVVMLHMTKIKMRIKNCRNRNADDFQNFRSRQSDFILFSKKGQRIPSGKLELVICKKCKLVQLVITLI